MTPVVLGRAFRSVVVGFVLGFAVGFLDVLPSVSVCVFAVGLGVCLPSVSRCVEVGSGVRGLATTGIGPHCWRALGIAGDAKNRAYKVTMFGITGFDCVV